MPDKLVITGGYKKQYLILRGNKYKSESFPYLVVEKLVDGTYHMWQVDNPNDWDDQNQYEILGHIPIWDSPFLDGIPYINTKEWDALPNHETQMLENPSYREWWENQNKCEYSGLPSVKSYEKEDKTFKQKSKWTKVNKNKL
jgi:hypothetical protein